MAKSLTRLADLTPDPHNANLGTKRGGDLLERSLERNGIGRSVLADKHGVLIAGNKTVECVADLASDVELVVVKTNGRQLVVVQREDLDLADPKDARARELAVADNRTAEVGLEWDANVLLQLAEQDANLAGYFFDNELATLFGAADSAGILAKPDNQKKTPVLIDTEHKVEPVDASAPHDAADEDQRVLTCPKCGNCWEDA